MHFNRVRITAFGRLRDLDTGEAPLPGLVVVQGANEAGKSTFFHFLTSLLYGFYPASRDAHPYAPWDGPDAAGEADIVLGEGETWQVQRRLLSTPAGSLSRNGTHEELRNRTLPCADHVPATVFRQVFALTLSELARLEGESWSQVQDRLVAGMGATDLGSVRGVLADLEREAGEIWRPNRRGNQKVRDLKERHRELRIRRRTAAEGDRRLRDAAADRDRVLSDLAAARQERESCRLYLERVRALRPVRDQLRRIDELEEEAGDPQELEGLPARPDERLEELERRAAELRTRAEELDAESEEPRVRAAAPPHTDDFLLERQETVRALVARMAASEPERVRLGQLDQEIRDLDRRTEAAAVELFEAGWPSVDREVLRSTPVGELRSALERYRAAAEAFRLADAPAADEAVHGGPPGWVGPVLALLGALALMAGSMRDTFAWGMAGALLLGVGATLSWMTALAGRARAARREAHSERSSRAREEEALARASVDELIRGLPLHPRVARHPSPALAGQIERLQELVRDREDRVETRARIDRNLRTLTEELAGVASAAGMEIPPDSGAAAHLLDRRLRAAQTAREAAVAARRELDRLERERDRVHQELRRVDEEREALGRRLRELGAGDVEQGVEAALRRIRARDRADQLRDEVARGPHDLDEARQRIESAEASGEDWTVDDGTLARHRAREEALSQRVEELGRRLEGLEKDMTYLRAEDSVDAVEGEILAVEDAMGALTRERDRRWALAAILREADRRFREEHQPDVLRQAGRHLSTITDGRYERILLGEDRDGTFLLRGPGYPAPLEVGEPVSTGTREQVYLALRLALLDHLDRTGERLPLFIDEAFVNWDTHRRERTFALLQDVSRTRQVFVFTCHEPMARSLEQRGARRVFLEPCP